MKKTNIQEFLENLIKTFLSIIKILVLSRFRVKFPAPVSTDRSCVILANGPSLSQSLKTHKSNILNHDILCVNLFVNYEYYELLKPKYYVMVAPEMWYEDVDKKYHKISEEMFHSMKDKTTWEMHLFVPVFSSRMLKWQKIIKQNKLIHIHYINTTPVEGFRCFRNFMYKKNLGMPRPHNVLIPSILVSLNLSYKKIYILGADHTWLKEISVNEQNEVLVNQKHFYDENTSSAKPMRLGGRGIRRLHEVLIKFVFTFEGYFFLDEYALSINSRIFNATPDSFIDAFERKDISNL